MFRLIHNRGLWALWVIGTVIAAFVLVSSMYVSGSREALLIGETTNGHHQIELACDACHTSAPFASAKKVSKQMNKACLSCHQDELEVSNDSHPVKKFRDPQNIARREIVDALYCATCHVEHKPEITGVSAVTLPIDFCSACHQEIEEERPSHAGLGFETCASAGCHNYHDNTALYEKFLVTHAQDPAHVATPVSVLSARARSLVPIEKALASEDPHSTLAQIFTTAYDSEQETDVKEKITTDVSDALSRVLSKQHAVAPAAYRTDDAVAEWAASLHAKTGVNCIHCHLSPESDANALNVEQVSSAWLQKPGMDSCNGCHQKEVETFVEGQHGMRFHPELPGPRQQNQSLWSYYANQFFPDESLEPMTVKEARLEMRDDAHHLETGNCSTCHKPHLPDMQTAAVDACVTCHNDDHSRNYFESSHFKLWQNEVTGDGQPGSGVSCADCHMPKLEARTDTGFYTTHNQNSYLKPNEKMIRPVCQSCHGLGFAIDSLADKDLVRDNFTRSPEVHVESIDWALGAQK